MGVGGRGGWGRESRGGGKFLKTTAWVKERIEAAVHLSLWKKQRGRIHYPVLRIKGDKELSTPL